jgi:hypothetical protein
MTAEETIINALAKAILEGSDGEPPYDCRLEAERIYRALKKDGYRIVSEE